MPMYPTDRVYRLLRVIGEMMSSTSFDRRFGARGADSNGFHVPGSLSRRYR